MTGRTLIVSAFEPEIAPLRQLLSGRRGIVLEPVGIGAVDAAVGAAGTIARARPARVIFVGTAGIYDAAKDAREAIGTVLVAAEIVCVSTSALKREAYLPGPMVMRVATSGSLRAALADGRAGRTGIVACPLAITRSAALGRRIAEATGAALENLEAFAVARAAAAAGIPFAAVLGVANRVGPQGHEEWRRHHRAASRAACEVIARFLA
ncbi:MAG TPA: phosphorylase [Polyangia bacterium]|nr:phosphorylase [Polyangia bacterium]